MGTGARGSEWCAAARHGRRPYCGVLHLRCSNLSSRERRSRTAPSPDRQDLSRREGIRLGAPGVGTPSERPSRRTRTTWPRAGRVSLSRERISRPAGDQRVVGTASGERRRSGARADGGGRSEQAAAAEAFVGRSVCEPRVGLAGVVSADRVAGSAEAHRWDCDGGWNDGRIACVRARWSCGE